MSECPPSSHISCHICQTNQSRVRTRVSVYFSSYSTGLQTLKPRVCVRVDRPTRMIHHSAPQKLDQTYCNKFPTTSPASTTITKTKSINATTTDTTYTSRSGVLTPHHRAGEPLRSSVRRDLRPCIAEPPFSEFVVR
ncbi:uncharacterized protein M6B38_377480 [Iris pallida]|uniref:Uncharacterized protein n=1 Tax=Iris pallida TaxID=29817 RepID=A0AAX6GBQ3_IRIPA|nr:uncharacterized protein M6B38_377480 [Iris pallida]